ncbi:MAG: flavodoxin domain-containing protein [Actinobacteria bacterium]|nr:flavodoxin domain-containing protein [Actinomycetota bacterium]MCG2802244.1 flavodoxin domain-containing protein [Cellulomonas sp.]
MQVLVSVSSRHGGTRELGGRVADALRDRGYDVDQVEPDEVEHVHPYDAVVLGTSVYVGRVGLDLKDLVERQGASLRDRKVWMFWSGPATDDPEHVAAPEDVESVAHAVGVARVQVFGGRVEREALSITERSLVALVPVEPGDHRDLAAAYAWGSQIAAALS